jgi:hypothetical protein
MKYVIWGIVGLVVLGVVVVGGAVYLFANAKVDFNNQQMTEKFKESFTSNCVSTYQKRAEKAGAAPTPEELSKVEAACGCARDGIIDVMAKRPPMTVSELGTAMGEDPEIKNLTNACSAKAGIAAPQ